MERFSGRNQIFWRALVAALILHALLLSIPISRQVDFQSEEPTSLHLNLVRQDPEPPPVISPPEPYEPEIVQQAKPELPVKLPPEQIAAGAAVMELEPAPVQPSVRHLLSRQYDYKKPPDPLAGLTADQESGNKPEFYFRERTSMETALNEPSLQLPFEDTRIYLVASYDPGLMGSVDRFFDKVTVPFGFTTRHGTRVQCAWIMVIAGCSWGPVRSYYQGKQARRIRPK